MAWSNPFGTKLAPALPTSNLSGGGNNSNRFVNPKPAGRVERPAPPPTLLEQIMAMQKALEHDFPPTMEGQEDEYGADAGDGKS